MSPSNWLSVAALVALLTGFILYSNHERNIGAARIVAQDAKLAAADRQHNADVKALADSLSIKAGDTYVAVVRTPIPDSPVVLCQHPAKTARVVPGAAVHTGLPDDAAHGAEGHTLNIGPALDTIGRDADAKIIALQTEVRLLVNAMQGKTQ